jgi:hypothetical protein
MQEMKPRLLVGATALLLSGCASTFTTSGVNAVILADAQPYLAPTMSVTASAASVVEPWVPSRKQAEMAFSKARELFARLPIERELTRYRCQFIGAILDGRKHILLNFFPDNDRYGYWKETAVGVDDGGDWFFQITYDVESQKCVECQINGNA